MSKDLIKDAILSWFGSRTHEYFDDLFGDGQACLIDGRFNLEELAEYISASCPISDAKGE